MNTNNNTPIMAMKGDGKMESIMKTGILVAGAVGATGLVLGMSTATAHAAETDTNNTVTIVQTADETAVPGTTTEAEKAVDTAQEEVRQSDAAVQEAQAKADEARQNVDTASAAADTARSEADKAFEAAKSDAADADIAAQKDVETAEKNVEEADAAVQQANENVSSAKNSFEQAERNANEAISESTVTENDITEKEDQLHDAENALNDAEANLNEAQTAKEEATLDVNDKELVKADAENAVREAETQKVAADEAVNNAEEAAEQATGELQSAEDLKNGTLDIQDTVQYREEQEAKEEMDNAIEKAATAAEEADVAAENLANAETAVGAATSELDYAIHDLNSKEEELSEAAKDKTIADNEKDNVQKEYDKAAADAANADGAVSEAEKAVADAKDEMDEAESAKNTADEAVKNAADAVNTVRQEAEADINANIENAEEEVSEKQAAVEEAQKDLDAVDEKYKQGTLGLINWMLEQDDLTKDQIQDLTYAREVLEEASEEDFSKWYGGDNTGLPEERDGKVVVIGDEKDATNLENLLVTIEIMKKINELRATDDNFKGSLQRNDAYTNFYFMATAEAGAMRGAGLRRHSSLTTSCEDLAFGYSDPTVGWYNSEKAIFDRIKGELGITEITSMDDIEKIEAEADNQGVVIGHYTNLFWAVDQVMGVGYTQYGNTFCYNASKSSNYTDDRYNRAMHLYTVEEFEKLVMEYYQSVNKSAYEEALENAAAEKSEAEDRLQSLKDSKDSIIETAVQNAEAALVSKEQEANQAAQNLNTAKESLVAAEKSLADANAWKLSADQNLQDELELLNKAVEESCAADSVYAYAESARDEAKQAVAGKENILKDALATKISAAAILEEKKSALSDANNASDEAVSVHAVAAERLADLTSDDTLDTLEEQKRLADAALQAALDHQISKTEALRLAESSLALAESEAANAVTTLEEAMNRLAEAILARDTAKVAVDQAAEELATLREQYEPVLRAIAVRDAAKEDLSLAEAALTEAETDLAKDQDSLSQAQYVKATTADKLFRASNLSVEDALTEDIEDPDFTYLNDYIYAIKEAVNELNTAKESQETANAELSARQSDNENARKAYIKALADLVIAQDSIEISQSNSNPSVKTVAFKESTTPDVNRASSKSTVNRNSFNKVGSADPVCCTDLVATSDTSNVMAPLAGLLAGVGLMVISFRRRKGEKETGNR